MIALLLALCTAPAPPPPRWQDEILCWRYDDTLICRPRVVNLGDFDPRPSSWDTSPFVGPPSAPAYTSY